ncbi:hypothetical protein CHLNCDRAFT_141467 [Chlorella variabilis]|uniref:Uncharacterized protein n=1 Tax=Chlorella variabilis TaxID=554065 RepID=E1ZSX6_CHLVA|nr:hypothetical protein CHLNCDRAFT_141467 [Chlorella variabilis]EFN51111.1 hypothetical protein CHLNCDRAFT_141467 [Chlorella variabilis]|eukprot:XP_005843213.1 hypothetical protein CHLNCDRAFT_141467 [Chlorella variabilis]
MAALAFASEASREQQHRGCEGKVIEVCTEGLRAGCSLQAARQCASPPLLRLLGLVPEQSWEEREACQQRCMDACLAQQTPACQQHAQHFCADVFAGPVAGQQQGREQEKDPR